MNLNEARTNLSFLLGETALPSNTAEVAKRDRFFNQVGKDVHHRKEWEWARDLATVPISNGVATLPSSTRQDGLLDIRIVNSGKADDVFAEIDYRNFDAYHATDKAYYLLGNAELGNYRAQLTFTNASIATVRYQTKFPNLSGPSDTYQIPNGSMILAKGALVYYRQQEDPQADVSQERNDFETAVGELMRLENRGKPMRTILTRGRASGYKGPGAL